MEYKKDLCLLHVNYILLADTVDRLDMILLELRHLQRNIIYSMHEPAFNAPLRFEEDFLWGGKEESDTLWKLSKTEDEKDVQKNIILFPIPGEKEDENFVYKAIKENEKKEEKSKKITLSLQKRINELWREEWRMRHQRSYDHLRGTQLLKRIIVQDKIDFCRFAINDAGLVPGKTTVVKPAQLSQFIILRNAIHQRCKDYLARIMEYQSLFNKVLDIGVKDFPVPSLERRREIGIYMDFLNKRVRSAHKETEHLVRKLKINKNDESKQDIILHSWKHDFTATHSFQEYPKKADGENEKEFNIHHVVSNYYMPERPDLQPMLTHEIAHIMIHEHMDDLSDNFLENADDNFSDLVSSIFRVLRKYDNILYIHDLSPAHNPRFLLKEICCDMLAASVKGFSYIYAMLLELVGADMHKHLLSGALEFTNESSRTIDLEMITHLYGNGGRPETLRRDWWLRLKLIVFWMEKVHHHDDISGIDNMLLEGVDSILDNFLCFLEEITLDPADRKRSVDIWRSLAERLLEEIEDSDAVRDVKKWRENRSKAKNEEVEDMPFPRSVAPINEIVRNTLKKIHIGMKIKEGKVLSEFAGENICKEKIGTKIDNLFNERCLLNTIKGKEYKYDYIKHLYDISWKCALTRTIDLFGIPEREDREKLDNNCHWLSHYDKDKSNKILDALHKDNAIGREMHSIALEFYMFESENPFDRLVHVYFLIKDTDSIFNNEAKKLIEKMDKSRGMIDDERKIEIESMKSVDKLINRIKTENNLPLKNYLLAYSKKDDLIENILNRITCVHNPPNECKKNLGNDVARCFKMLLISRHTASGFYAMKEKDYHHVFTSKEYSPVSLLKGESYWFWPPPQQQKKKSDDKQKVDCVYPEEIFKYSNVSGRYDAISFVRARHMRRCSFPHFETKNKPSQDQDDETKNKPLDEYSFPSILTRREFGIKVDLRSCGDCTPHKKEDNKAESGDKQNTQDNELAGYISVTLKRRALRLPFLARLMAAVDNNDKVMHPEKWLGAYLKNTDTALLLDGSADFLLVLRMNKEDSFASSQEIAEHRLRRTGHVIDMAYWLYQDFMVDRTEIILSAAVLDDVAEEIADKYESEFSLECELRCFEDRMLAGGIDSFREQIEKEIKESKESKGDLSLLVTIEITAGRKDFLLRFFHPACCVPNAKEWKFSKKTDEEETGFRAALAELLDKGDTLFVDRIEVNVNKKPPKERLTS
uniref:hypothetical protein n=1 Tax=Candidatus Electronema sp. TaxID=2698783 RepID=UPI00405612B4